MSNPSIRYATRPDATPESELEALANVFAFLIERHEKRTAVEVLEAPEDAEKGGEHERELNDASS